MVMGSQPVRRWAMMLGPAVIFAAA